VEKYHKIQSVFKRDPKMGHKTFVDEWSMPEFGYLADKPWVWTEKVDGTNIRLQVLPNENEVKIKGKSDNAQIPPHLMEALSLLVYERKDRMLEQFPHGACLYGEGYGPKINNGGKYTDTPRFVLFDVRVGPWWLKREDVIGVGLQLDIDVVPEIMTAIIHNAIKQVKQGYQSMWGDFIAEGLVGVPLVPLLARNGQRIITKIKHKDFQ
jgi:hypothetical protein